ncbi:MAG: hydantoin utilization protein A [Saprospiraceae bacterium]|nr:MAG: hydantoin utilization protein A [Saprospiraceae bacterium]
MDASFPLLFAAVVGFGHAFEADHLVAVGNIVSKRDRIALALKDGIYWGMGHTSTIFLIGLLMIIGKANFLNGYFGYFEAIVGLMLILLGLYRLFQYYNKRHKPQELMDAKSSHHLAYNVGLVHGLAGSGAMILLVMTEIQGSFNSMLYLLIFGIGSVVGMLVAAGIFSLPFSKRITNDQNIQGRLIILSSLLCIGYGAFVMIENLF